MTPRAGWEGGGNRDLPPGVPGVSPGVPGTYQPHLAFRTLVLCSDAHVTLIGSRARYVPADATDDGDAAESALIRRRTTWVDPR